MNIKLIRGSIYTLPPRAICAGAMATVVLICGISQSRGATVYAIDINDADDPITETGWTALDALHTGSGGTVVVDGITFAVFSAQGARVRGGSVAPNPNPLTADFVYDDGASAAVGLRFGSFANQGTLAVGTWQVEVWVYDATAAAGTQIVGYQTHDSTGVSLGETIVSTAVEQNATDPAITFDLIADGGSFYSVFTRENNESNRSRLNAVRITSLDAAVPGDFDSDGDVDGADFVAWQTNFPTASGAILSQGDADGDGDVDGADFVVWQTNFPFTPAPGAAPVPEPAAIFLAMLSVPAIGCVIRRQRSR